MEGHISFTRLFRKKSSISEKSALLNKAFRMQHGKTTKKYGLMLKHKNEYPKKPPNLEYL